MIVLRGLVGGAGGDQNLKNVNKPSAYFCEFYGLVRIEKLTGSARLRVFCELVNESVTGQPKKCKKCLTLRFSHRFSQFFDLEINFPY